MWDGIGKGIDVLCIAFMVFPIIFTILGIFIGWLIWA